MPSDPGPPTPEHGRAFHRVVYPVPDRPRIVLADGTTGRVIDCSEHGLRYRPDRRPDARHPLPAFGVVLEARIEFLAAPDATVAGRVIRVDDGTVALYVASPPIPLNALFAEQRALRVRYPFGTGEGQPPAGG